MFCFYKFPGITGSSTGTRQACLPKVGRSLSLGQGAEQKHKLLQVGRGWGPAAHVQFPLPNSTVIPPPQGIITELVQRSRALCSCCSLHIKGNTRTGEKHVHIEKEIVASFLFGLRAPSHACCFISGILSLCTINILDQILLHLGMWGERAGCPVYYKMLVSTY